MVVTKTKVVSRRSTEVEYHVIDVSLAEVIWIGSLFNELHISCFTPIIYSDNLGAVVLAANLVMYFMSKHFKLDLHFVRDHVLNKRLQLIHVSAYDQVVDLLTMPVSGSVFLPCEINLWCLTITPQV